MAFVFKCDVLSGVGPMDIPAGFLHGCDEGVTRDCCLLGFQYRLITVHQIGSFHLPNHGLIFLFAPGNPFAFFYPAAVKVFPFFGHGQVPVPTHLVHDFFHSGQIFGCGVQLVAVLIADSVSYQVKMEMATVLMDSHQDLVARKFLFCELLTKCQHLIWSNFFVFVE